MTEGRWCKSAVFMYESQTYGSSAWMAFGSLMEFVDIVSKDHCESMISHAIACVIKQARLIDESVDSMSQSEVAATKGKLIGKRLLRLFGFMTELGHSVLSVERNDTAGLSIEVKYDMLLTYRLIQTGTQEYLDGIIYGDVRKRLQKKVMYNYVFVTLPQDTDKV